MDKIKQLLNNPKIAALVQFFKFGIVGVSNTLISYGTEMLCYYLIFKTSKFSATLSFLSLIGIDATSKAVRVVYTSAIAFIISVTNSYYWNNRFVFKSGKKSAKEHFKSYFKTVLCYGITGLVLSPLIKIWLVKIGIPFYIASFGSLVVTIPLNFVLNKFWAFASKGKESNI